MGTDAVGESRDRSHADTAHDERAVSLRSVADGASLHYLGTILITLAGFLITLVLTRTLGAGTYGIYAYGTMIVTGVLTFAHLGADVSVTRYLSANRREAAVQRRMLGLSYATSIAGSLVVAIVLFGFADPINAATIDEPAFTTALQLFAIAVPCQALAHLAANTFRGLERPVGQTVVNVATPVFQLVCIVLAVLAGFSLAGIVAAYVLASLLAACFGIWIARTRTRIRPTLQGVRGDVLGYVNYSVPLAFSKASSFLFKRVDVFMVGILLGATEVGIYSVAVLLATAIAMPLGGINQLFPPVASRLHSNGAYGALESVYRTVTRWSISASLVVALPLLVYRSEVLAVFGPEFVAGSVVVVLFVFGQLCNAAAGPANDVLTMTDHQYVVLVNHTAFGVLNVVLNYVLILQFGLAGAAVATAGVLAALNVVRALEVWYLEGLLGYSVAVCKPMVATAVSGTVLVAMGLFLDGFVLLVVGPAAGVLAFVAVLYALGIEAEDRQLIRQYREVAS